MKIAKDWEDYQVVATGDGEKLEKWLTEEPDRQNIPITMVFQTTQTKKVFN